MLLIYLVYCFVFLVLFVLVLCLVPNVVCVSGLSLIDVLMVFSNIYSYIGTLFKVRFIQVFVLFSFMVLI